MERMRLRRIWKRCFAANRMSVLVEEVILASLELVGDDWRGFDGRTDDIGSLELSRSSS